jgi:uncharacterized protein YkwD/stress response protein SCP2
MGEMVPGGNQVLPQGALTVRVAGRFDVSALVTGESGKVVGDGDFVFYNQPSAPGVRVSGDTVAVDPRRLRAGATRVTVVVSAAEPGTPLGRLPAPQMTVTASGGETVARFTPPRPTSETVLLLAEIYRRGAAWKLRAIGQGYAEGLAGLARDFGVTVVDDGAPHAAGPHSAAPASPQPTAPPAARPHPTPPHATPPRPAPPPQRRTPPRPATPSPPGPPRRPNPAPQQPTPHQPAPPPSQPGPYQPGPHQPGPYPAGPSPRRSSPLPPPAPFPSAHARRAVPPPHPSAAPPWPVPAPAAASHPAAPDPGDEEGFLGRANVERARAGVPAVALDGRLAAGAREHAAAMAAQGSLALESPDGTSLYHRVAAAGYACLAIGEQIVSGPRSAPQFVDYCLEEPETSYPFGAPAFTHVGVGCAPDISGNLYWAAVWASPFTPDGLARTAAEVVTLTNAERATAGLPPLTADPRLTAAAQAHSDDMSARGFYSHTTPEGGQPWDRAAAAGATHRGIGENIASGQRTAAEVVSGWMTSPGHRRNILKPEFTHIGVGYAAGGRSATYWTQLFGHR